MKSKWGGESRPEQKVFKMMRDMIRKSIERERKQKEWGIGKGNKDKKGADIKAH